MKTRGITLVVCLVFLALLSILGVSALTSSTFHEKMTANTLQREVAFQAADTALRDGERWIDAQIAAPTAVSTCTTPPCRVWQAGVLPDLSTQSLAWWQINGTPFSSALGLNIANTPYYIIEFILFAPDNLDPATTATGIGTYFYRITSYAVGPTTDSQSIVQSVYATRYN